MIRLDNYSEIRLATLELESGHYLDLTSLLSLVRYHNRQRFGKIIDDNAERFMTARGSTHNHQAWKGGYLDHVRETMNIACQLYRTLNGLRKLPFQLSDALEVMFLHDIEKPFKQEGFLVDSEGNKVEATKANREQFRRNLIVKYDIKLTEEQDNAMKYVEGVPDNVYTPNFRIMRELAAFCHCCDILSARLWHDRGQEIDAPEWERFEYKWQS